MKWTGLIILCVAAGWCSRAPADEREFSATAAPLFKQFCFDCHGNAHAEAGVNLENLAAAPAFETAFKTWRKVAEMLEERKMPPADMPQPDEARRKQLVSAVRGALGEAARALAGDPGEVIIRRLTSAEYGYTIQDLTGLDLDLARDFVSDAVGGEGFTNVGQAQFVQDATLERYLEAARRVAAHAVIGAGPLDFYRDPGRTGLELSAIDRIQRIYRRHGFRTSAGEGAEPFGLERYPKAFHVAWLYRHRAALGRPDATLAGLAAEEQLEPRFAEHIWSVLSDGAPSFPASEIVSGWRALPRPSEEQDRERLQRQVRTECAALYDRLHDWQMRLAGNVGRREQAAVLGDAPLEVAETHEFEADIEWSRDEDVASVRMWVSSAPVGTDGDERPVVLWREPRVRFRLRDRRWSEWQALQSLVSPEDARQLALGTHPRGAARTGPGDFVLAGAASRSFRLPVPDGARGAELVVEVRLDREHGADSVVRCAISQDELDAPGKTVSALIANPEGAAFRALRAGARELARKLPQVSHREPAPSDRDPIPPPFDNTYDEPERDHFHIKVKYHRDDAFLVEHILDDAARRRLDEAWADLLGSFEYHDVFLRFVADKYGLDLGGRTIGDLDDEWIERPAPEPREHVRRLRDGYEAGQRRLRAAEPRHLADVVEFAQRAWRRPLSADDEERLLSFYRGLRSDGLAHAEALRAVLARVLVAPDFLYRAERTASGSEVAALSDRELAARLSYFLWSSLPDDELRRAAAAGELRDPEELARQARRMLRDSKARRLATEFFGQWFGFYQFDRYRGIDPERFPEFDDRLRGALYDEAISFFEHIIREDRPAREILFADYAFLNRTLADHYGIEADIPASELTRVEGMDRHSRGGLLGLGAVLTVTSAPLRTSPVKRGDWILRRVLGTPVPPPPPDAGSIPSDDVLADGRTVRERLEAHRQDASCMNCHSRIDPLGFALEHFDPLGRWRVRYRDGQAIDASGMLHDGTTISGPDGLRDYLGRREPQFRRVLSTKLLGYAVGRAESLADQPLIDEMRAGLEREGRDGRFSDLVVMIVTSRQFRYHRGRGDVAAIRR